MKRNYLLTSLFILLSSSSYCQTLNDPIYFNFTSLEDTNFKSSNGSVASHFFEFNAIIKPIEITKKLKLINGLYYRNTNFEFDSASQLADIFPTTLHDIRYTGIVRLQINKNWDAVAIPRIMIRSDLNQNLSTNDFFPQVVALANYAIKGNQNFKIGLGFALNNDFERNAIIPIGALTYDSKKVKIEIVYPNANFLYKSSDDFEIGLFATVDGAISRVNPFLLNEERVDYIRNFQILIAPTISHRITNSFFGHLKVGVSPVRNFDTLNADFDSTTNQKLDVENSFFFRIGFSYRLKQ